MAQAGGDGLPTLLLLTLLSACLFCIGGGSSERRASWREDAFPGYSEGETVDCTDRHNDCKAWGERGECTRTPFYMLINCPSQCLPACSRSMGPARFGTPHNGGGKALEFRTRAYATSTAGITSADGHFRRDPSLGEFLLPGQKLRSDPWLYISSLGVGTHLGEDDAKTDMEVVAAIIVSVAGGWNVIDTASHYRSGRAERAVGTAVQILAADPRTTRDMLFISSKAGHIGTADVQARITKGGGAPSEAVINGTCMDPVCLKASIDTSLARMNLHELDVLYLDNVAEAQLHLGRQEFMRRLEHAFAFLETERESGRIQAYGMATTTCFRSPPSSPAHLSLAEVVSLATKVAGSPNHGFRYIQLPVSAVATEAWTQPWQPFGSDWWDPESPPDVKDGTVLEVAARLGVGVFGVSPLEGGNLLSDEKLTGRLREMAELSDCHTDAGKAIQMARSVPLLLGSIVGHKLQENVRTNLLLAQVRPLPAPIFKRAFRELTNGVTAEDL